MRFRIRFASKETRAIGRKSRRPRFDQRKSISAHADGEGRTVDSRYAPLSQSRIQTRSARGSLATRVRRTLRRAARTTSSQTTRGARTARRFRQHYSRAYSGPHAGVRLDGTARPARIRLFEAGKDRCLTGWDFPRRSSRRARARREASARGTRAGARFARLRARASVDRASLEVPRVSRRARAAQRGTAALTCRVRFVYTRKRRRFLEARRAGSRVISPGSFPFATFRISRKGPTA